MRNFLLAVAAAAIALPAQPLANDSFQILTSPTGLTSLKRVHDAYDTDYIAGGRALGNVLVRYKLPAETSKRPSTRPGAANPGRASPTGSGGRSPLSPHPAKPAPPIAGCRSVR
jgi:hypothetical protein